MEEHWRSALNIWFSFDSSCFIFNFEQWLSTGEADSSHCSHWIKRWVFLPLFTCFQQRGKAVCLFPVWNTKSLSFWKPAQGGPVASCLSLSQYGSSQFLTVPWTLPRLSLSLLLTLTAEIMSFQLNLCSILSFCWWPSYLRCKHWDFTHPTQDPPIYCLLSICDLIPSLI